MAAEIRRATMLKKRMSGVRVCGGETRVRAVKRERPVRGRRGGNGGFGEGGREEVVHFSAEIQAADWDGAQDIVREKLEREICTVGKNGHGDAQAEGKSGRKETAMRERQHVASCAAMPDGRTVLLTAEYESEESCVIHINDEVMPLFEKLETEKLLAEFDEECNADEHAENCKGAAISMAMYAIGADGRIGPCTFNHTLRREKEKYNNNIFLTILFPSLADCLY